MNTKITPKDFFLHLGATIALYVAVIAFLNLVFSIINYSFPDALAYSYFGRSLAWPMSMVIVLVPLVYVLEWLIARDIRRSPEKSTVWVRRWRIYLTLFLTGATIVGTIISLINTYLSGEISSRFIWKIVTVLIVMAVVFAYYLLTRISASVPAVSENLPGEANAGVTRSGVRAEAGSGVRSGAKTWIAILSYLGAIIAVAGIVGGFVIVGSPTKQRDLRFDQQKVSDLQNINWQILSYWQSKGRLPETLVDLRDSFSYSNINVDPQTKESYVYSKTASTTYNLCAVFNRPTEDTKGRGAYNGGYGLGSSDIAKLMAPGQDNWDHGSGRVCFDRKIDPERYPPMKPAAPVK
jgi:hypothetical protein